MLQYSYNIIVTNVIIHPVNIVCTSMCSTTNHFIYFFVQHDTLSNAFVIKVFENFFFLPSNRGVPVFKSISFKSFLRK